MTRSINSSPRRAGAREHAGCVSDRCRRRRGQPLLNCAARPRRSSTPFLPSSLVKPTSERRRRIGAHHRRVAPDELAILAAAARRRTAFLMFPSGDRRSESGNAERSFPRSSSSATRSLAVIPSRFAPELRALQGEAAQRDCRSLSSPTSAASMRSAARPPVSPIGWRGPTASSTRARACARG